MSTVNKTQRLLARLRETSRRAQLDNALWALVEDGEIARSSHSVSYIFSTRSKAEQVRSELATNGREVSLTRLVSI